jgi:hypothetical protein
MDSIIDRLKMICSTIILKEDYIGLNIIKLFLIFLFKIAIINSNIGILINSYFFFFLEKVLIISLVVILWIYKRDTNKNKHRHEQLKYSETTFSICYYLPFLILFTSLPYEFYFLIIPLVEFICFICDKELSNNIEKFY